VRAGYIGPHEAGTVAFATVPMTVAVHNAVDDDDQRPKGGGGVYALEAIEPGVVLRGVIRCRVCGVGTGEWWRGLAGEQRLGRSRKDDFGRVTVEVGDVSIPTVDMQHRDALLWVWCLSDVLLDGFDPVNRVEGRSTTSARALAAALGEALGAVLEPSTTPDHVVLRTRRHESWHVRWAMPRASLVAIGAGSVACFRVVGEAIDPTRAERVMIEGIGLRRAEGFGDIALNDPLLEASDVPYRRQSWPSPAPSPSPVPLSDEEVTYAWLVERAVWRSLIEATIVAGVAGGSFPLVGLERLSASQLGALRVVVRAHDRVHRLERLSSVRSRAERWGDTLRALDVLFRDRAEVWRRLRAEEWPSLTPGGEVRLREALWEEAIVILIDELARRDMRADATFPAEPS
jgi:CRISPR-associated protein Csx10